MERNKDKIADDYSVYTSTGLTFREKEDSKKKKKKTVQSTLVTSHEESGCLLFLSKSSEDDRLIQGSWIDEELQIIAPLYPDCSSVYGSIFTDTVNAIIGR